MIFHIQTNKQKDHNMKKIKLAVFISGRGSNYQAIQNAIDCGRLAAEVLVVISDRPNAAGLEIAKKAHVPTETISRKAKTLTSAQYNTLLADTVESYSPDLIVLAGFMRILGKDFISRFRNKIINIHPSLLPSFPGLHPQKQAILAGVCFSGCTVHLVTEEVDKGPILAQAIVPVFPSDSAEELSDRILKVEHKIYPACIQALAGQLFSHEYNSVFKKSHATGFEKTDFLLSLNKL